MEFLQAVKKAINISKSSGKCCYVFQCDLLDFDIGPWREDWLFQSYPGGRKILSIRGKEIWAEHGSDAHQRGN